MKLYKEGGAYLVFKVCCYIFFAAFTLMCIYPFYYLIINSISANDLSANGDILLYPKGIHFTNYIQVIKIPGLLQACFISVSRTAIGTFSTVLVSAFLGFLFSKETMWMRKFWYRFLIATMYFSAGLIPWYLTMMNLGLLNNFSAYILPALVSPFNIILIKTYIESTPLALQESAEIDGAGTFKVFFYIIAPLCKPILATIAVFCAVGQWNSFYDTLLLMTNDKLYTLQFLLYRYINQASSLASLIRSSSQVNMAVISQQGITPQAVKMTVSVIVVLPILLVYPLFQGFFVEGIMIGAVKG
jgi:putative aldouronate transport system permease protein